MLVMLVVAFASSSAVIFAPALQLSPHTLTAVVPSQHGEGHTSPRDSGELCFIGTRPSSPRIPVRLCTWRTVSEP